MSDMNRPIVAVVGRPNVGKSTIFNKFAGKRISIVEDTPGVTRDRIFTEVEWLNKYFTLIDTGGIEPKSDDIIVSQMRNQAMLAMDMAHVILMVVDGKQGITAADREIAETLRRTNKPVILVVNKIEAMLAMDMAHVILMVVDGKQGITAADREIAETLRRTNKPVILVVNKIDSMSQYDNVYDFYELGLGEPFAISGANSMGLGDLLDEIVANFPEGLNTQTVWDLGIY